MNFALSMIKYLIKDSMPTYRYRCECGHEFDYEQRISDAPLKYCPFSKNGHCEFDVTKSKNINAKSSKNGSHKISSNGSSATSNGNSATRKRVERLISSTGFILKGSGWAKDGYAYKKEESCKVGSDSPCTSGACSVGTKSD